MNRRRFISNIQASVRNLPRSQALRRLREEAATTSGRTSKALSAAFNRLARAGSVRQVRISGS